MRKSRWLTLIYGLPLLLLGLLYGKFLENPLVFDDVYFFLDEGNGAQPIDRQGFVFGQLRSLPYATLAWTKLFFGPALVNYRMGNLLLHMLTAIAVYGLLNAVFSAVRAPRSERFPSNSALALLGATLFALHPVATYAVGYLIQRTTIMATLFSVACLLVFVQGLRRKSRPWLWFSVLPYYLAVFSKEHAVMLFALPIALTVFLDADWRRTLKRYGDVVFAMVGLSAWVVLAHKSLLGVAYEPEAQRMLANAVGPSPLLQSIITQCGLFFKYLALWLAPDVRWMSIDMREPFVPGLFGWATLYVAVYVAWGLVALRLLIHRGEKGLLGLAMFFPWVLFFTEFASVRIQEPFVLYRSYLWAFGGFFALPCVVGSVRRNMLAVCAGILVLTLALLSMERLVTLSQPILLWTDALKLVSQPEKTVGVDRIYYNLGVGYLRNDMLEEAQKNLKLAVHANPDYAPAYAALAGIYNSRGQWTEAVQAYTQAQELDRRAQVPPNWRHWYGRARAHEAAGNPRAALSDYAEACKLNMAACEALRKSAATR